MEWLKGFFGKKEKTSEENQTTMNMANSVKPQKDKPSHSTQSILPPQNTQKVTPDVDKLEAQGDIRGLIDVMNSADKFTAIQAGAALGRTQGDEAIAALVETLGTSNISAKLAAALALAKMNDERAVEPLIFILEGDPKKYTERDYALESLVELSISYSRTIKPLVNVAIRDENPDRIDKAVTALLKLDRSIAMEPLMVALNSKTEDLRTRWRATKLLGILKIEQSTDSLINALKDENKDIRETATWALGEIGSPQAINALDNLNRDEEKNIKKTDAISDKSEDELVQMLVQLCLRWATNQHNDAMVNEAKAIGDELNRRDGIEAMRKVFRRLNNMPGSRTLDMWWGGIGDWQG